MIKEFEQQVIETELPVPTSAALWLQLDPPDPNQILTDTFDAGDKVAIIGSSKMRKTFFLLQLLLSLASGFFFLHWQTPKPRRVFHIQFEIQQHHYHRRVKRMSRALGITPENLGDRFYILNARGLGISGPKGLKKIGLIASQIKPDIISFDPLYKIATGAENAAEDLREVLSCFDELAKETGAAIIYVHHDSKGNSGDRDVRDRGAGSNVLGRDYDACITLTPHVTQPDAVVIESLLRNYKPQEPFVVMWTEDEKTGGYRFDLASGIPPAKKTSSNARGKDLPTLETYLPAALDIVKAGPIQISIFMDVLRAKTGLTHARSAAFRKWATTGLNPVLCINETRSRGQHEKLIGTPEQFIRLTDTDPFRTNRSDANGSAVLSSQL